MFVIYTGNHEILITTDKKEHKLLKECFGKQNDREIEDYDRDESHDVAVCIESHLRRDW